MNKSFKKFPVGLNFQDFKDELQALESPFVGDLNYYANRYGNYCSWCEQNSNNVEFPLEVTFYLHSDKESNYETIKDIVGNSKLPEKFMNKAQYALYEVKITGEFNETGEFKIKSINDKQIMEVRK